MPIHNADVAALFEEIADLLEIGAANPFRVRAYRNAARMVSELPKGLSEMIRAGEDLDELPGIGADLAAKIQEIVTTGKCAFLDRLRRETPSAVTELLKIPRLGPKRVKRLYDELAVQSADQLYRAARDKRIRDVPGFGEKTELHILQALEARSASPNRFKLAVAAQYADSLCVYLKKTEGVEQVVVAGSFRRARDTVGDLDILVTASDAATVTTRFADYDEVAEVLASGATRSSVRLRSGLQVDLRVVAPESFGAALVYFTGSKAHNIALRRLGQERGLKINEYGVFRGARRVAGETEESIYAALDLPYIAPELREDRGEIEAARAGHLPELVTLADLKGDLHAHTKATDGHDTIRQMAEAARAQGLEYLAITEHSRRLAMAHGLDPVRLAKQIDEIDRLNASLSGFTILKGIEVDILEDGSLDLPDTILSRLDVVVAAVHSQFNLSRAKQTARVLRALDSPHVRILAHPTGRLIGEREPYDVDMLAIIRKARQRGCFLELNAHPARLDLLDSHCRQAKEEGVLVTINSDAHSSLEFAHLRFGVGQARRGWLSRRDVLNTRPLGELRRLLKPRA